MNWHAIHTKPRQEAIARGSLEREVVETFLPKLRRQRTIRRVRRWVTGPLFPGYLFARFDSARSVRLVTYANGVTNIVSFGGKPARVDDAIIAEIRNRAEADVVTIMPPKLRRGDRVEIQAGPFSGLQGVFDREISGQERVVILLDALARGAKFVVDRHQLERVS